MKEKEDNKYGAIQEQGDLGLGFFEADESKIIKDNSSKKKDDKKISREA